MKNIAANIASLLNREIREIAAPISKEGIDVKEIESQGYSDGVKATDFPPEKRPQIFTPSTVILNGGYGIWELNVPKYVLRTLVDMTLRIETIRTHGMLHTPPFNPSVEKRYATILVNGGQVDKISLVKPHPHGRDFGVDSRRPFQVFRYIDKKNSVQEIRIEVDDKVRWDIDKITLEPITLRREITPKAAMLIGAAVGAILSFVLSLLII